MGFAEKISAFVNEALGVSFEEMAIQIISTVILFLVVRYFFWEKVTNYLETRHQEMTENYQEAEVTKKASEDLKKEAESELINIKESASEKYNQAKVRGEEKRKEIVDEAKKDAKKIIANAHKEVDSMVEKAKAEINDEIVSVATLMAEKIIEKEIDETKHKQWIEQATSEVMKS
ncbi:MAG: F0F1 ATP synthase subunit B [Candidatus Izimaplasma sp.]|nr:F0F1 ATP synthase subunit B [Candidatus Izimaplasma bacterium]